MSGPNPTSRARPDRGRAARLQQVFGDVLPEREPDEPEIGESLGDAALLRDVPPHHG